MKARGWLLLCLLVLPAAPVMSHAGVQNHSGLALRLVDEPPARFGPLAQRVIEREWGLSEDSTYRSIDVPGWKSEGVALALSGAVPGVGHLYLGEGSGWFFLLAEATSWVGRTFSASRARDRAAQAADFVGNPYDTTSGWSFERWQNATGSNSNWIERLWENDREAFYNELRRDPQYVSGFSGQSSAAFQVYRDLRAGRDGDLRRVHIAEIVIWTNHVASAFDALRAARLNNLPLRNQYQLQLGERTREGRRELRAALVRRF